MGIISGYSDDAVTTDGDKFLTYAADGTTKNTPASNVNKYLGPGWTLSGDSWSYSSYNSTTKVGVINANSGANTLYTVGNWIKFSQPTLGVKYAIITATATTSITAKFVNGTILANEAITSPVYSVGATPNGSTGIKPEQLSNDSDWAWSSWTPTWTNVSGGATTYAKYRQIGKTVHFRIKYTLAGAGVSGTPQFTLPVTAHADYADNTTANAIVGLGDTGAALYQGVAQFTATGTKLVLYLWLSSGPFTVNGAISSTNPFTFGNTDTIEVLGEYDAA